MDIDDRIALAKELIARREGIDLQLLALFNGSAVGKPGRKCRICGEAGHRSDNCPQSSAQSDTTQYKRRPRLCRGLCPRSRPSFAA